ncbi:MAG: flagellar protein FlgN [Sphingomonadales bacterium 32-68-7]|nr:MAG: flagellar protein FlgN [Sphingomonadales bacterium 12-68-11]OYX10159.1 MAG: flagellar protein FlgN [Sphingomonadales bacterium 32-68-7]
MSLAQTKDALRQMLAVMEQERQALAGLDLEAIMGCAADKTALCDRLSRASNDNLDEECRGLIEATRRLNEVNRQVRNLVAANVSSRLDALTGAPGVYKLAGARAGYARLA